MRWLSIALVLFGCGSGSPPIEEAGSEPSLADELAAFERALLEAESLTLPFEVTAEGALEVGLQGELRIEGAMVRLTATGTFGGEAVDLQLHADESFLFIGESEQPRPPHLKEALVLGLTRMGILHNLAVLTTGQPPDHSDVGVEPWLRVRVEDAPAYSFTILVDGESVAEARLTVAGGRPVSRQQTVAFPEGEMQVRETYGGGD